MVYDGLIYPHFLMGLGLVTAISFLDDLKPVPYPVRMAFQVTAVVFLFIQLRLPDWPVWLILAGLIFTVGTINAVNFMDGINGMTAGYGLVTLITLRYIDGSVVKGFVAPGLILAAIWAAAVFSFFNFRTRARCFAGDTGSIALGFILAFFIGQLMLASRNPSYLVLLLVYGMDTVTTIVFKCVRKENIFIAHRDYYFQYLVHEKGWPHVRVSTLYGMMQLLFNFLFLVFTPGKVVLLFFALLIAFSFIVLRFRTEGKRKLLKTSLKNKVMTIF